MTVPNFRKDNPKSEGGRLGEGGSTAPLVKFDDEAGAKGKAVVLVPFESSDRSLESAKVGLSIARHTGGHLVFCHALLPKVIPFGPSNPPWVNEALRHEAMEKMKAVLEIAREAGISATCEIEPGTPVGVIIKVARRWGADLIVLAAEKQGIWSRLLFGSRTTEQVLDQAECHVMVLRNI